MLRTPRLILRDWRDDDLEPWTAMGRDREVMAFFPTVLSRAQSADALTRIREHLAREGFGFWAVEVIGGPRFIGFCGLGRPGFTAPFTPCVEIGWRLARAHWGQGYATEAARAALAFGFESLQLAEIVAFLVPSNVRSARVAEHIGMHRDRDGDFDHPRITPGTVSVGGHPAQRHALYRIAGGRSASGEAARASRS